MCGIVGYVGEQKALPVLIQGLEQLEYRGYDSAGIACYDPVSSGIFFAKEQGKLSRLKQALNGQHLPSVVGIGHTRWATHGVPSNSNAHPHFDCRRRIAVVHNGIIENYQEIKDELIKKGHRFESETDTEVIVHLIEEFRKKENFLNAFRKTIARLDGFFALVALSADEPDKLFVFRRSNPLIIGVGRGENFVASDATAVMAYTKKVIYLNDNQLAVLDKNRIEISEMKNKKWMPAAQKIADILWSVEQAKKEGFPHYMLKEIFEQPRVIRETFSKRVRRGNICFDSLDLRAKNVFKKVRKVFIVSCGTAYHAGLVARYMFEEYARMPVEVQVSSEFRYSDPIVEKDDLVILITQSGETADTLAALREAKSKKAKTLAIVNVVGSTIAREADFVVYTHAGPEIGVASTKAYMAQLATLALFSVYMGLLKKKISAKEVRNFLNEFSKIPGHVEAILKRERDLDKPVEQLYQKKNFLFLGRGYNYPGALEGALKLKEISYAHAHGYAAGEMKHGPIALIDSEQPVICLVPESKTYDKMVSNIQEIRAREGIVFSIATENDKTVKNLSNWMFSIPKTTEIFSSMLVALPLQLFAYKVSVKNNRDVDQPRNLAKSVTVE